MKHDQKKAETSLCHKDKEETRIEERIFNIRGKHVMLDKDLAILYGVETRVLNQAVKRNRERFPEDFMFQLGYQDCLRSQIVTLNTKQGIFFDGQIFDSYTFVLDMVRSASRRIVLIDNYIDDTVLTMLSKRADHVEATIYTMKITKQRQLDIDKHNAQYPAIEIKTFTKSHDRFLIIDDQVYLIGASIKDIGKKWFGFTLLENTSADDLMGRIGV